MKDPSLIEIFQTGGLLMLVALLWMRRFIPVSILFFIGRLRKPRWTLLIFPLGFVILALSNFVMQWYFHYKDYELGIAISPDAYMEKCLEISRATLTICSAAGFSLVVAALGIFIPQRTNSAKMRSESRLAGGNPE